MNFAILLVATLTFVVAPALAPSSLDAEAEAPVAAPAHILCEWFRWLPLCTR